MAAPKGNSFWKARSKHGRDKIFSTPEILWDAVTEYFNWCERHPWFKNEAIKSGDSAGKIIAIPTVRPMTLTGLCIFLKVNTNYFNEFKQNPSNKDFSEVITRIEEIIYTQKFEGAAIGAFNANIIARDLGLADKKEISGLNGGAIETTTTFDISKLSDEEKGAIASASRKLRQHDGK